MQRLSRASRWLSETPALQEVVSARSSGRGQPSIAVLHFKNLTGDKLQDYFSEGVSETIITQLAKIPQIVVVPHSSSFSYKGEHVEVQEVGRALGVRYVLEGGVQRSGDRVRITAKLIEVSTGKHLWAERYDREAKEIFTVQDEITLKIVKILGVKLSREEWAALASSRIDLHDPVNLNEATRAMMQRMHDDNLQQPTTEIVPGVRDR